VSLLLFVAGAGAAEPEARRAGPDWWSLQPVKRPAVPTIRDPQSAIRNPIDAFVLAELNKHGLRPNPPADRTTLIRRATFDLTGLPPTPAEIDAFVNDPSPDAWEKVVDRLLASPRYGERWGRHWLDIARFGESNGFERDQVRDNAWRYRDYVIRAFNDDRPYPQFVQEQLAGDVPPGAGFDAISATGFLVCGPWDEVAANVPKSQTVRLRAREEELEDMVGTVGQTFLGLTVNCARCHAHKFDPIPQADYYRLRAAFDGVRFGDRRLTSWPPWPAAWAAVSTTPGPTHVLIRGDVDKPAEQVGAAGLSAIRTPSSDLGLALDAPEGQRRLKLAEWIGDPLNPLPPRVLVNRVWHWHFGQGIVRTPSDFGFNGDRPSHPDLLEWLAAEFVTPASGGRQSAVWGSVKRLHRLIMTSATYQQASAFNPDAAAKDADNRLLWRFAPRRIEGEAVRDALLFVSGQLNDDMGGPGFRPFTIRIFNSHFYTLTDPLTREFNRRTVYRIAVHSAKSPLLDAFDCPDPSTKTPRRSATTTPLQALALMNNAFVLRQAGYFAERVQREAGAKPEDQVTAAYRLALGRMPTKDETGRALALVREHGVESLCWVLLNASEFLYVR
jgi:hypothetical protein